MAIDTGIPTSYKIPLFVTTVDGSQAGNDTQLQPVLLIGQKLTAGIAQLNTAIPIGSPAQGTYQFGAGSMLDRMVTSFFASNTTSELWVVPVGDPSAGTAATGSISITSAATQSGVLYTYIAGQLVQITVMTTDTIANVATKLAAAINALSSLPVTATVDSSITSKVDLTCKWIGLSGNDIQISFNYLGLNGGQSFPVGLAGTIVPMSGGNGEPDYTTIIANIQSQNFVHIGLPYSDTASFQAWDTEVGFGATGRWDFQRAQYAWVFNAVRNDYADALELGATLNSKVISSMIVEPTAPSPVWEWTASYTAVAAAALTDDPARPLQTLVLSNILPALSANRFNKYELNNLTTSGFAIQAVNPSGQVAILREALQYQFNAYGQGDTAFGLITVLSNLAYLLTTLASAVTRKWPRHKLAPDGTKVGPGQPVVTPSSIKAELISVYNQAIYDGEASSLAAFIANLTVQINDQDPNKADVIYSPVLMGQLRQFDALTQFYLEDPTSIAA